MDTRINLGTLDAERHSGRNIEIDTTNLPNYFGKPQRETCNRHLLVEGRGVPLSLVVTGAQRHDVTQVDAVLDAIHGV